MSWVAGAGITDWKPGRTRTSGCGTLRVPENGITDAQPLDGTETKPHDGPITPCGS